jgi:Asp-tRNA(Asn)/Glu-tRNA(Gln) amidotransferase C subunit
MKTGDRNITVVLTDSTKAQKPKGLGLRKTQMSFSALIPGLRITVAGVYDAQNRLVAKSITLSGDDLRAAEAIQAGLTPTQQAVDVNQQNIEANKVQIAANHERIGVKEEQIEENDQEIKDVSERFSNLTEFDTRGETTVFFASGSKSISAAHRSTRRDGDSRASRFQRNLSRTLAEPTRRGQSSGKPRPRRREVTFTPPARVAIC